MEALQQTMAKRARGSTSRPGQRPRLQRQAVRPVSRPAAPTAAPELRSEELTAAEEARAAQLEAAIVAEEREAEAAKRRTRPSRSSSTETARPVSNLTISAADEYAYVARDVKRIAIVGGSLVGVLLGIWLIVHITGFSVL
jgi:hypothetical protein